MAHDFDALSEKLNVPVQVLQWVDRNLGRVARLNAEIRQLRAGFVRIGIDPGRYECELREKRNGSPIDDDVIARFETPCTQNGIDPQAVYHALGIEWEVEPLSVEAQRWLERIA